MNIVGNTRNFEENVVMADIIRARCQRQLKYQCGRFSYRTPISVNFRGFLFSQDHIPGS